MSPLSVERHVLGHRIAKGVNLCACLVGVPTFKDTARLGWCLGFSGTFAICNGLISHRRTTHGVEIHRARLRRPLGVDMQLLGHGVREHQSFGTSLVHIPTREVIALAHRIVLINAGPQVFFDQVIAIILNGIGRLIVCVVHPNKEVLAAPASRERHVAVNRQVAHLSAICIVPAAETIVLAGSARQVGTSNSGTSVHGKCGDLLGVLRRTKGHRILLRPFGVDGGVLRNLGREIKLGLELLVGIPAHKAIALARTRLKLRRRLTIFH